MLAAYDEREIVEGLSVAAGAELTNGSAARIATVVETFGDRKANSTRNRSVSANRKRAISDGPETEPRIGPSSRGERLRGAKSRRGRRILRISMREHVQGSAARGCGPSEKGPQMA